MKTRCRFAGDLRKMGASRGKGLGLFFFLLLALAIFPPSVAASGDQAKEILILHTNNVTAHLFPCPS